MSITIFGIFFAIALLFVFINNNIKMLLGILLFSMCVQSTSVVMIGDAGVGPQLFASTIFFLWILLNSKLVLSGKIVINAKERYWKISTISIWLFFGYIAFTTYGNYRTEIYNNRSLYVIQLLIYIICYLSIPYVTKHLKKKDVDKIIEGVIIIVVVIGIIQFLTTVDIFPRNFLLETFVYNNPKENLAYNLYYPRVFSVFLEPSYCAPFLVGGFFYLISREIWNRKSMVLAIILAIEIILTFSSTAYGATLLTGIVYIFVSKNKKALKFLIPLAVVMILLLFITGTMQNILSSVIFNKMDTGSGHTRNSWDKQAWNMFLNNPLFGMGYKMVRGSRLYLSILGQIGIVGTILYVLSVLPILLAGLRRLTAIPVSMFLVGSIASQMIAIPDLDFCVFWLSMYLVRMMLAYSNDRREKNDNKMQDIETMRQTDP